MKTDFFHLKNFIIKRYLKVFFICVIVFGYCHAQVHQLKNVILIPRDISFINNKKIEYSIVLLSCDTCVPISNIGHRVKVNLTKKERKIATGLNTDIWLSLLKNSKTDWAANLILYDIYSRDAFILSRHNSKERWVRYFKQDDVRYWEKQFSQ